jgi:hypothetical protein
VEYLEQHDDDAPIDLLRERAGHVEYLEEHDDDTPIDVFVNVRNWSGANSCRGWPPRPAACRMPRVNTRSPADQRRSLGDLCRGCYPHRAAARQATRARFTSASKPSACTDPHPVYT